ncbi:bifunctional aminoglycoside phosphotransferase/ATP-binding protein [Acidovorax sp. JHL-3]|uniref:bifunctional aminoglycoside phosphotransferase/ATP-binding protein n=1 Tax=Acidovorax sp. JHL-3 TaxID=1276755 RepID=UPI0004670C04|nr:bifunctional aminoglycoside phosphotransferase/ATP-binding protein [Acidovorax sp. JHL-3]
MVSESLVEAYAAAEQRLRQLQCSPAAFDHPAGAVEWIETHISWLVLAGDFVYKFKKPLKLDFLDFSTPALRRGACEEELRINRRTAPALYLGLVALTGTAHSLQLQPAEAAPADAEPAVRMRRFAQEALLSHLLEQQRLLPSHIDALAQQVAQFHASAAVATPQQGWGTAQAAVAPVQDCLAALQPLVAQAVPDMGPALRQLAQWCASQGTALAPVFLQRLQSGRVRECHGDLHLANLVLIDGQPQLFDAIEFNPALRWIDCVADIAFLAMDLEARGRTDLAWRFLNAWLEHTGDYAGLQVLQYYRVYRALVRARVAGLRLAQVEGEVGGNKRAASLREVLRYLALALRFTEPRTVELWLAHGFSGAGKSTQSQALIAERGVVRVRADVERKRLFGLAPQASSAAVPGGIYTAEASERTHEALAQAARWALGAGHTVLVDATFLNPAMRQRFMALATQAQVPCRILSFEAPLAVLRERVRSRQLAGGDASEASVQVLESQWAAAQPLSPAEEALTVHVDTTRPVDWSALLPPGDGGAPATSPVAPA